MAKLSIHGDGIQIEYLRKKKAYCSDGKVLINYGGGWKLYAKIKPGLNYKDVAQRALDYQRQQITAATAWAEYRNILMKEIKSLEKRNLFLAVFELMPDDPDGVYSETHDCFMHDMPRLDLDTICQLSRLHKQVEIERQSAAAVEV